MFLSTLRDLLDDTPQMTMSLGAANPSGQSLALNRWDIGVAQEIDLSLLTIKQQVSWKTTVLNRRRPLFFRWNGWSPSLLSPLDVLCLAGWIRSCHLHHLPLPRLPAGPPFCLLILW